MGSGINGVREKEIDGKIGLEDDTMGLREDVGEVGQG